MGRMADVMAADLVRLAPGAKPKIEANLATLKQRLLKLSADSEARLASADVRVEIMVTAVRKPA